jgi:hypothetical protein
MKMAQSVALDVTMTCTAKLAGEKATGINPVKNVATELCDL